MIYATQLDIFHDLDIVVEAINLSELSENRLKTIKNQIHN